MIAVVEVLLDGIFAFSYSAEPVVEKDLHIVEIYQSVSIDIRAEQAVAVGVVSFAIAVVLPIVCQSVKIAGINCAVAVEIAFVRRRIFFVVFAQNDAVYQQV